MLEAEKFINEIFENCISAFSESGNFDAEAVLTKTYSKIESDKAGYWQKKNMTDAMNILERMKLISSEVEPEFTKNIRFLKEVRYGEITRWGKIFSKLPKVVRCIFIYLYRRKSGAVSILGVLSFVHLSRNAYSSALLLSGWLEYISAAILLYILYLFFKGLID